MTSDIVQSPIVPVNEQQSERPNLSALLLALSRRKYGSATRAKYRQSCESWHTDSKKEAKAKLKEIRQDISLCKTHVACSQSSVMCESFKKLARANDACMQRLHNILEMLDTFVNKPMTASSKQSSTPSKKFSLRPSGLSLRRVHSSSGTKYKLVSHSRCTCNCTFVDPSRRVSLSTASNHNKHAFGCLNSDYRQRLHQYLQPGNLCNFDRSKEKEFNFNTGPCGSNSSTEFGRSLSAGVRSTCDDPLGLRSDCLTSGQHRLDISPPHLSDISSSQVKALERRSDIGLLTSSNNQAAVKDDEVSSTLIDWTVKRCVAENPEKSQLQNHQSQGMCQQQLLVNDIPRSLSDSSQFDLDSANKCNADDKPPDRPHSAAKLENQTDVEQLVFKLRRHAVKLIRLEQRYREAMLRKGGACFCGEKDMYDYHPEDGNDRPMYDDGGGYPEINRDPATFCRCSGVETPNCTCDANHEECGMDKSTKRRKKNRRGYDDDGYASKHRKQWPCPNEDGYDEIPIKKHRKHKQRNGDQFVVSKEQVGHTWKGPESLQAKPSEDTDVSFSLISAENRKSMRATETVGRNGEPLRGGTSPINSAYRTSVAGMKKQTGKLYKRPKSNQPHLNRDSYVYNIDITFDKKPYSPTSPTMFSVDTDTAPYSVKSDAHIVLPQLDESEAGGFTLPDYLDQDMVLHQIPAKDLDEISLRKTIISNLRDDIKTVDKANRMADRRTSRLSLGNARLLALHRKSKKPGKKNNSCSGTTEEETNADEASTQTLPSEKNSSASSVIPHASPSLSSSEPVSIPSTYVSSNHSEAKDLVKRDEIDDDEKKNAKCKETVQNIVFNGARYRITVMPMEPKQSSSSQPHGKSVGTRLQKSFSLKPGQAESEPKSRSNTARIDLDTLSRVKNNHYSSSHQGDDDSSGNVIC